MRGIYACAFEEKSKGLGEGIFEFRFFLTAEEGGLIFLKERIFYCCTYTHGLGAIFQKNLLKRHDIILCMNFFVTIIVCKCILPPRYFVVNRFFREIF
jgi:hypothetical protein